MCLVTSKNNPPSSSEFRTAGFFFGMLMAAAMLAGSVRAAEASVPRTWVWIEKPSQTNFAVRPTWGILSEGDAVAVMPPQVPAAPFVEYDFEVPPSAAGRMEVWGRTFAPSSSSPARWRVDAGPWQDWKPEASVDWQIEQGYLPMGWCRWGRHEFGPGRHRLRVELLGKRPQGDYYYFVSDVLLLTKGEFRPQGTLRPDQLIARQVKAIQDSAAGLPAAATFNRQAAEMERIALTEELGTFAVQYGRLLDAVQRARQAGVTESERVFAPAPIPAALREPLDQGGRGVFVDRYGLQHRWHITRTNALVWDGEPYLPFGGMYVPRYTRDPNEATLAQDQALLTSIRTHGIRDLYLNHFTAEPARLQRVMDLLETLDFRYGIHLDGPLEGKMPGYQIDDALLRTPITANGVFTFTATGAERGLYCVAAADGRLLAAGAVTAAAGQFRITVANCPPGGAVIKLIQQQMSPWINDAATRQRVQYVKQLRFGPGFRFFIDPITNEYAPPRHFLPASADWRNEFAGHLRARYGGVDQLARAWGLTGTPPADFAQAARLIPLVAGAKDSGWPRRGYCLDDVTGQVFPVEMPASRMWADMCEWRELSLERRLTRLCDAVKAVCDVPVIAKRHHESTRVWINRHDRGGLDGLGMESYGTGDDLGTFNGAATYADIAQAKRPMWCVVTEYNCSYWSNRHIAYQSRGQMYRDLNLLLSLGAKGIFMFGLNLSSGEGDTMWTIFDLRNDPRQMEWLATFGHAARMQSRWLSETPQTAFWYPTQNSDAKAFAAGDLPDYGLSGSWAGKRAVLPLGPDRWITPVFFPDARGTLIGSPLVTGWPGIAAAATRCVPVPFDEKAVKLPADLSARFAAAPRPPVTIEITRPVAGVESVSWPAAAGTPYTVLRSTGPAQTVRLAASTSATALIQRTDASPPVREGLPRTITLPAAIYRNEPFVLNNPQFGVTNAAFTCEVGDSPAGMVLIGIPPGDVKLERAPPARR